MVEWSATLKKSQQHFMIDSQQSNWKIVLSQQQFWRTSFLSAHSSLLFGELDELLVNGQALLPPHVIHVLSSDVLRIVLLTEVQQLLLRSWHPKRIHVNNLPVTEDQLRHCKTGGLFPKTCFKTFIGYSHNLCYYYSLSNFYGFKMRYMWHLMAFAYLISFANWRLSTTGKCAVTVKVDEPSTMFSLTIRPCRFPNTAYILPKTSLLTLKCNFRNKFIINRYWNAVNIWQTKNTRMKRCPDIL